MEHPKNEDYIVIKVFGARVRAVIIGSSERKTCLRILFAAEAYNPVIHVYGTCWERNNVHAWSHKRAFSKTYRTFSLHGSIG